MNYIDFSRIIFLISFETRELIAKIDDVFASGFCDLFLLTFDAERIKNQSRR